MRTLETALASPRAHADIPPALVDGFDATVDAVAHDIAATGWACVRDAVTDEWLDVARDFVQTSVDLDGVQELYIENFAAGRHGFAHQLATDPRVEAYLRAVAIKGLPGLRADGQNIENELRLVSGPPQDDKALWYHYDGTVVTMVVPILIPKATPGTSGELVLSPNRRPFRRSVITNIIEKSLSQNDFYRRRFVKSRRGATVTSVPLEPGNAYLFCGYRSYHATMPCPPDTLRVTLILHFGAVHQDSQLLATVRSLRQKALHWRRPGGPIAAIKHDGN